MHSLEGLTIALIIHSLDPTRLAIIDRFPFNPTYDWPIVLPRCLLARSDYWHVAVVLNFYLFFGGGKSIVYFSDWHIPVHHVLLGILGVAIIVSLIYRIPHRQWLRTSMEQLLRFRAPPWRQTLSQHLAV